jgi:carbamoyl-phosphate synthase / aspartate carbamoyltransferase
MAVELKPPSSARLQGLDKDDDRLIALELEDGSAWLGHSFGAPKTVSGEMVFQTGLVGCEICSGPSPPRTMY